MSSEKTRVGLYGGTFSPPHLGHVRAAREFAEKLELDRLVIMPANIPPHKEVKHFVDGQTRLELCRIAFGKIEKAEISDYEISKKGVSYTVETLRHMHDCKTELFMLCGDDMFLTLDTWRCAEEIFSLTSIVCMRRYLTDEAPLLIKKAEYEEKYGAVIYFIDAEAFPVSSTEIRERLINGESCEGLLDSQVELFAADRKLYFRDKESKENEN